VRRLRTAGHRGEIEPCAEAGRASREYECRRFRFGAFKAGVQRIDNRVRQCVGLAVIDGDEGEAVALFVADWVGRHLESS